jgi:hypothetical protein
MEIVTREMYFVREETILGKIAASAESTSGREGVDMMDEGAATVSFRRERDTPQHPYNGEQHGSHTVGL